MIQPRENREATVMRPEVYERQQQRPADAGQQSYNEPSITVDCTAVGHHQDQKT